MIKYSNQKGITLIEVMVTAVVLAIGILGCISLQTMSVIHNQETLSYSQATLTLDSMFNEIRSEYRTRVYTESDFDHLLVTPISNIELDYDEGFYTAKITWDQRGNRTRSIEDTVYVGKLSKASSKLLQDNLLDIDPDDIINKVKDKVIPIVNRIDPL